MSKLIISIWEVCDPKELPKSLEMTMAMNALLKIRKAQITPRFLDFANEILTFIANNLEKFKDDLDFLREMSDLPKTLSKNEAAVLDLSLPQKESSFFLNEIVKIASKYNIVMLIQGLKLAFLPDNLIYPADGNEKWQTIINVPPPKKLKAFKKWAKPIITAIVKRYGFDLINANFAYKMFAYNDGFYYQKETAIGTQLIGIELFERYGDGVFYLNIMGASFAQDVLDVYDKFNFRPEDRYAFFYNFSNTRIADEIHNQADFYYLFTNKVEIELIQQIMNKVQDLEGLQALSRIHNFFGAIQSLIINYLCNTLTYEIEQELFLRPLLFPNLAPEFLSLHNYIHEQLINTKMGKI